MLESAWLFVGILGTLWTVIGILCMVVFDPENTVADNITMMMGFLGLVCYGVFTYGSLNVQAVTDSSVQLFTMPSVTILGIALSLVPGYIALAGPANIIKHYRRPTTDEL